MIAPPPGVRVRLACGHTDMRDGMTAPAFAGAGLAVLAQQVLREDPFGTALANQTDHSPGERQAGRRRRITLPNPTSALPSNIKLAGSGTVALPTTPMIASPWDATAPVSLPLLRSAEK
jgi:hypothetical protein